MRLLAVLVVVSALVALGAWGLMHARPSAIESALASAPQSERRPEVPLAVEPEASTQRQEAAAPQVPLVNSSRIRGRVVRGSQSIPVAGVEVRCTKELPPTRIEGPAVVLSGRISSLPSAEGPSWKCTSGPEGEFEFVDLDRAAHFSLQARGDGWVVVEPLHGIVPSEDVRDLAVQRIYVARVLATDEDGKPPMTACQYLRYARTAGPGECPSLPLNEPKAESSNERGEEYSFTSDCDASQLGPFRILICCPGFERQDFEFWAYPKGSLAQPTVFHLVRAAYKVGELRVRQECGCEGASCMHLLEGPVELESIDDPQKKLSLDLDANVRECLFQAVPTGRWRVRVKAKYCGFCYPAADLPALELTIGDEPALLQIPVADLGVIDFRPELMLLRPLSLTWEGSGGTRDSFSVRSGLIVRGVQSGPQTFRSEKEVLHVDVIAGKSAIVVVHQR